MSSAETLEQAGDFYRISGRDRLRLTADHRVISVVSGSANLFVQLTDDSGAMTGYGRMVAALPEGAMLPLPDSGFNGMALVIVGVGSANVQLIGAAERSAWLDGQGGRSEGLAAGLAAFLDVLADHHMSASSAFAIAPGATSQVKGGTSVSAAHAVWIEAQTDEHDDTRSEPVVIGLAGPGRSVFVEANSTVAALSTQEAVRRHGWAVVDRWASETFLGIGQSLVASMEERRARIERRREDDADQVGQALSRLPAIVGLTAADAGADLVRAGAPAMVHVINLVCRVQKIPFDPSLRPGESDDPQEVLQDLLRRANLRFRKVALTDRWWQRDGLDMVGFDAETSMPIAILRRAPGRYDAVSGTGGERRQIDRRLAATLHDEGFVIFKPLPFRPLKAMDLVRHVLSGQARFDMRWAAVLAVATALIGLVPPLLIGKLLNEVVPFAETEGLIYLALGLAFVAIGSAMFQMVRSIALLRIEAFADGALQAAVWDRLLRLPLTFFRKYEVGDLLIKATGPTQLRQAVSDTALSAALSAIFSVVNFGLMVVYDGTLALVAVIFTLVTSLVLFGLARLQLRFERVQLKADAAVSSFIIQILVGIQKIRLMGAEDRAFARWVHKFADQRQHILRAARIGNAIQVLNGILPVMASILFFYMVGSDENRMSVGSFVAFNAAFGGFHGALLGLVGAVSASLSAVPIYENMKPLLSEQPEIDPARKPAPAFDGAIHLSNVFFRYDTDGPLILNGIDLTVRPGQFVAFVGPSGSGKSTIFRLLLGFETPEQGTVGYDGLDLGRLDLKTVRRQIGVVLQRGAILPGSIFENIVGSAPLSQEDAWEAARMAGFDEDIQHMPMGMHTVLTEGGGTLSGGQRQRLMIARAVVRKPRILLMDEATSALDNRTQAIVSESLAHLNATRVVIAHRLSTVVNADRIFVVDAGRIAQSGTYEELMAVDGPFRELARRQIA